MLEEVEASARPVIAEIALRSTGSEAEAEVSVTFESETFIGTATGASASSQRPRLVAAATLTAIAELSACPPMLRVLPSSIPGPIPWLWLS